jgi:predicted small lipoprotein YifL
MSKFFKKNLLFALVLYAMAGCYPKGPESYSDLDLTITDYNPDYSFATQKKYFMPDTVSFSSNTKDDELTDAEAQKILNEVETNLTERGYERLDAADIDNADFVISVSVVTLKNTGVGWTPYPPLYPGWGWGGGYYPPYWGAYYSYSYTTGSIIIEWYDPQESSVPSDKGDLQPIDWVAALNGLVSQTSNDNTSRIEAGINQAFIQSPYIQSN